MALGNSLRDTGSGAAHGHKVGSGSGGGSCSVSHQATLDKFYQSPPSVSRSRFDIDLARSKSQVQPRVGIMLTAGAKEKLGKAWAKWFHANDIPGRKADCPYFRSALKLTQQLGEGVHIPRGREIDGPLLDMNYEEMEVSMEEFKAEWNDFGVTIMCDSWTGPTMMSIINFMIFCNGRMFFHKTVDATREIQNADFIYSILEKVVVEEVGIKNVVQIVTDNDSNYNKACEQLTQKYPQITWQPCAAHTINLMLKDISRFPLVNRVVESARRIYRFLYNHNRVHAMMKEKLGGELIKWNATRFGTVFLFLQSLFDRKEKFKLWVASDDWEKCKSAAEEEHGFVYDCVVDKTWWSDMELVLKSVSPLYFVLRFADQQKGASISRFLEKAVCGIHEIRANLSDRKHKRLLDGILEVVNRRLDYLLNDTLVVAASALDPKGFYDSKIGQHEKAKHAVTCAIRRLAPSPSKASAAIDQYVLFRKHGRFVVGDEARRSALAGRLSAADWWDQYGGDYPDLQYFAKRIVSQCMSSSGCERNWSTFALVHTKLRNRIGYDKLHKLVYVHYNLKLRIQQFEADIHSLQDMQIQHEMDSDPYSMLMEAAMFDDRNPIMDWLCNSRSESKPILGENVDSETGCGSPYRVIIEEMGLSKEDEALLKEVYLPKKSRKKRKIQFDEEESAEDIKSDSVQGSPTYAESGDSGSNGSGEGDDGAGDTSKKVSSAEGTSDGGNPNPQPAPSSLRPRSKRVKKVSVKHLY